MICEPNTIKNLFYDEDGEICVSGPSVMLGYLNNPEETRMVLKKHDDGRIWLHTGDVGSMDKNGVVYFKTRLKRMIISAGYNVYPSYIENIINQHPSVLTSVVVGVPDEYRGEVAKAFIVLKPDVKQTPELDAEIRAYCKKHIAKYSLPVAYEYRDDLPKTKINKVDYRKLQ
jgi:long-chain acyl-CoA synthetase